MDRCGRPKNDDLTRKDAEPLQDINKEKSTVRSTRGYMQPQIDVFYLTWREDAGSAETERLKWKKRGGHSKGGNYYHKW